MRGDQALEKGRDEQHYAGWPILAFGWLGWGHSFLSTFFNRRSTAVSALYIPCLGLLSCPAVYGTG
jgi:hypothetical protein